MTDRGVTQSVVEQAVLGWLQSTGWQIALGPEIAADMPAAEPVDFSEFAPPRRPGNSLLPKGISGGLRIIRRAV